MAYYIWKSYKLKLDPFQVFAALSRQENCFFLDSSLNSNPRGRYSFLGIEPFFTLKTKGEDPLEKIRGLLREYKITAPQAGLPFCGGAVGYFAYELGFALEKKIKTKIKPDYLKIPDCCLSFYHTVIAIDHFKKILHIFATGLPEKKYSLAKLACSQNFKKIYQLLSGVSCGTVSPGINKTVATARLDSNFSEKGYLLAVERVKEYIRLGDIYQLNLSQQFSGKTSLSALEIYLRLRNLSPSWFSAYFDAGDFQILSSSPERFLKLEGNKVVTCPMKGTRPRSKSKLRDQRLKRQLLESEKDKAELLMIVDLERNDLGRVCTANSIKVDRLRQLEPYRSVFQTTAEISGRLDKGKDGLDLLRACFPGGSITGCPKIRAMQIIEELEPTRRSIYTGALGYLSFCGNMDLNILIRTILKKNDNLCFGVGGGIVADSSPEAEYRETLVKAKAIREALAYKGGARG